MLKIVEWGMVNWNELSPTTGVGAKQKNPIKLRAKYLDSASPDYSIRGQARA